MHGIYLLNIFDTSLSLLKLQEADHVGIIQNYYQGLNKNLSKWTSYCFIWSLSNLGPSPCSFQRSKWCSCRSGCSAFTVLCCLVWSLSWPEGQKQFLKDQFLWHTLPVHLELQVSDKQLTIPKVPPRTPSSKQNLKKDNS